MDETAYAKINLALRVGRKRSDGYHDLDTLFAFAEDGDRLSVEAGEGISLRVVGPFARDLGDPEDNLVLRAARLLGAGGRGAALTLDKRLPVASGIGGGSADAAAALRLLARWWGLGEADLMGSARSLGADVPACLLSRTIRGKGRGDELIGVRQNFAGTPVLLVNPGVPVATAEVFGRWKGVRARGNDLEPPALEIAPAIGEVLDRLHSQPGVRMARMSGSGATCFALFASDVARDQADRAIAKSDPRWWRLASRLR